MSASKAEQDPGVGIVGRHRELAILGGALDAARDGIGSVVTIAGEPGIGKTTLARALSGPAGERGVSMVWGRCWDAGGAPAYWPWRQIVRVLAADLDDAELLAATGPEGRWLVRIAPELDARLPGEDPAAPAESEQGTFALFEALARFLRAAGERGPVVLVLDDLHAADIASLRALDLVSRSLRELPMLVVATLQELPLRARPDAASLIAALDRQGVRIDLDGLDAESVRELLVAAGAGEADTALVRRVHDRSAGNPLFATEIARVLAAGGGVEQPLAGSVQSMIRDRLAALGAPGTRMITAASVIGQEFRLLTVEGVAGVDRATLLDLLDEAEDLGILEVQEQPGSYRFRHGLIRETLYRGLRRTERAEAHRRVGEVLRDLYPDHAQERHLSELAHHFVEAASLGDPAPGVHFSRLAGRRAMASFAFEQAADHLTAALRVLELAARDDDATRAGLMLELGQAQAATGHPGSAATLLGAADLARALADHRLFADVALAFGPYALSPGTVDDAWVNVLEEAVRLLGDDDPARLARLQAQLGRALYFAPGAGDRRQELADSSVALARSVGDLPTLAAVLSDAHVAAWGVDRTRQCLEWIAELHRILDTLGDPRAGLPGLVRSVDLNLELGDSVAANIALGVAESRAAELFDARAAVSARLHRSRQAIAEGRFGEIPALLADAQARGERMRYSPVPVIIAGQSYVMRLLCGGLAEMEPMVRQSADGIPGMPVWRAALARLYVETGRGAEALRELDHAAENAFAGIGRDNFFLLTLSLYGEVAWREGAPEHAPTLYELLVPFADRLIITTGAVFLGPVSRILGQLAALQGDVPGATGHFDHARDTARRIGAAPSIVLVDADEAAVRLAAGRHDSARALLTRAEAAASDLGMAPTLERVGMLRRALDEPATPAGGPAADAGAPTAGRLAREGDTWALELGGRRVRLRDTKGLHHLAMLLAHPGVEVHAIDLVANGDAPAGGISAAEAAQAGLSAQADAGGPGPALDDLAKAAYRERIRDLREDVEEAERFNDPERAAAAREELDAISAQLAGAVGLGGRDRTTGSAAERARVNVTRALRATLRRIAEHDPGLGSELEAGVRTGIFCCYEPSALHPVVWEVDRG